MPNDINMYFFIFSPVLFALSHSLCLCFNLSSPLFASSGPSPSPFPESNIRHGSRAPVLCHISGFFFFSFSFRFFTLVNRNANKNTRETIFYNNNYYYSQYPYLHVCVCIYIILYTYWSSRTENQLSTALSFVHTTQLITHTAGCCTYLHIINCGFH